jgi:hypothetical protein
MSGHIAHQGPAQAVGTFDSMLITVIRGPISVEGVRRATDVGRELGEQFPGAVGALTIVEAHVPMPDSEARAVSASSTKESDRWVTAAATVMLGDGFWMSAARSVYTGIMLLARGAKTRKVFGDADEGAAWLAEELGFEPAQREALTTFIEEMRGS